MPLIDFKRAGSGKTAQRGVQAARVVLWSMQHAAVQAHALARSSACSASSSTTKSSFLQCVTCHAALMGLAGAVAQVWCLAVSRGGDMCVSAGADRSLRVWQRTEEPFFVEEEKEKRLESLFEADLEARPLTPPSCFRKMTMSPLIGARGASGFEFVLSALGDHRAWSFVVHSHTRSDAVVDIEKQSRWISRSRAGEV